MTLPKPKYDIGSDRSELILQAIDNIEKSIADISYWKNACKNLAALFDSKEAFIILFNLETNRPLIVATNDTERNLVQSYWSNDGAESFQNDPLFKSSSRLDEGAIVTNEELIPNSELHKTVYYKDVLSKLDIEKTLTSVLMKNAQYYAYAALIRGKNTSVFTDKDKVLLQHLSPYLKLGLRAYLETQKQKTFSNILVNVWLGEYSFAVFQLNKSAKILQMNDYAKHLVDEKAQLSIIDQELTYEGDDNVANQFVALIENSCHPAKRKVPHQQLSSLEIDGVYFRLIVIPLKQVEVLHSSEHPACLVVLQDRGSAEQVIDRSFLQMAFDFSKAELRVAEGLSHGSTLKEIAEDNGISVHTVRAQLRSIFAKSGLNSQSSLIRFLVDEASYQIPKRSGYKSYFQTFSPKDLYDII